MKTIIAKLFGVGLLTLAGVCTTANASTITFNGEAFMSNPGGGSATYLHVNGNSGGGTLLWGLGANQDLSYAWTRDATFEDSTAVFGSAGAHSPVELSFQDLGIGFDAKLRLGVSADAASNTLTVGGGASSAKNVGATPVGPLDLTNQIGGQLTFELLDDTNFLLASGSFLFDELLNMGPFNKVGQTSVGGLSAIAAYIWGGAVDDNFVINSDCQLSQKCTTFASTIGQQGLGFDFAFTGVSAPESPTLMLLIAGLFGAFCQRRFAR